MRGYGYLAALTLAVSLLEFGIAVLYAKSSSLKTDAMHAGIHSSWYGLAIMVSWLVNRFAFAERNEMRLRAVFGLTNFLMLVLSIGIIIWFDALPKWRMSQPVNSYLMFAGGLIGLCGNWLQLGLLKKIKIIILQQKGKLHDTFEWSKVDVLTDLWLSVAVTSAAAYLIGAKVFGLRPWFRLDSLLTFIAVFWVGYTAFDLFIKRTAKNL